MIIEREKSDNEKERGFRFFCSWKFAFFIKLGLIIYDPSMMSSVELQFENLGNICYVNFCTRTRISICINARTTILRELFEINNCFVTFLQFFIFTNSPKSACIFNATFLKGVNILLDEKVEIWCNYSWMFVILGDSSLLEKQSLFNSYCFRFHILRIFRWKAFLHLPVLHHQGVSE